jgi:ATP-dependent Clp endopeptidase proteolytic subunit ClpP
MGKLIELPTAKKKFEIKCKTETLAEIELYGSIGESFWDDSISAKQFSEELKKLPSSVKEISLRVNSPGGSVFDGMTIYERLRNHPAKVVAYVDGLAASIASIIIMAADEIVIGDGALVMIHKPLTGIYGNSTELEKMIDILDKIESQMVSIYAKKTGLSRSEITASLAKETWYTSDEAIELGFADRKIEASNTLQLVASASKGCPWLKNMPEVKNTDAIVREKLRELNNKVSGFLKK